METPTPLRLGGVIRRCPFAPNGRHQIVFANLELQISHRLYRVAPIPTQPGKSPSTAVWHQKWVRRAGCARERRPRFPGCLYRWRIPMRVAHSQRLGRCAFSASYCIGRPTYNAGRCRKKIASEGPPYRAIGEGMSVGWAAGEAFSADGSAISGVGARRGSGARSLAHPAKLPGRGSQRRS